MSITLKTTLCTALLMLASTPVFSGSHAAAETHKHTHKETHYVKPGAAVSISHDYDGQTLLGEIETLSLTLTHIYTDGYITAAVLPSPHLQIASPQAPHQASLSAGSTLTIEVQFAAIEPGTHNLSVEINYADHSGHSSRRVVSVPIYVGQTPRSKTQILAQPNQALSVKSNGVIAMPAIETIR